MSATSVERRDREAHVRERLEVEASTHRMRVFRDDGLYRHLRFTAPGTWAYGYDLITWPGQLAIAGDCGDYTFARTTDMFEFFRSDAGRINPDYWSEKLTNRDMRDGTGNSSGAAGESCRASLSTTGRRDTDDHRTAHQRPPSPTPTREPFIQRSDVVRKQANPVYNPCPFGVPAAWVLRVDPIFYGGVAELEGGWYGFRSGDRRVPAGGPFDVFQEAREWVVGWCLSALENRLAGAMDVAVQAQRALMDLGEEFDA